MLAAIGGRGVRAHDGAAPARLLRGGRDHGDEPLRAARLRRRPARREYDQFYAPGEFPLERLRQARSVEAVVAAAPLYSTFNLWRCPPYPPDDPAVAWDDERPEPGPIRVGCWATAPPPAQAPRAAGDRRRPRERPVPGADPRAIEAARPRLQEPRPRAPRRAVATPISAGRWSAASTTGSWANRPSGSWAGSRCSAASPPMAWSSAATRTSSGSAPSLAEPVQFGFLKRPRTTPATVEAACRALATILPPDVVPYSRGRDPRARVGPLGEPDVDRPALRLRRARRDDRGRGGRLPGALQRRPRPPARVRDAQGHGHTNALPGAASSWRRR